MANKAFKINIATSETSLANITTNRGFETGPSRPTTAPLTHSSHQSSILHLSQAVL